MADKIIFKKDYAIFTEGSEADCMYQILEGTVGIYSAFGTSEQKLITTLKAGALFGEMALVDKQPRSATAVAHEQTTLRIITDDMLEEYCKEDPESVLNIMSATTARLRQLSDDYVEACVAISDYVKAEKAGQVQDPALLRRMERFTEVGRKIRRKK